MDAPTASGPSGAFLRALRPPLPDAVLEEALGTAADVTLLLDADGVIREAATSLEELATDIALDWIDRPWSETVEIDSRKKVSELLHAAGEAPPRRWRQVNHRIGGRDVPVRYVTIPAGDRVLAVGRDLREAAALQQRLLRSQQEMERDSMRLRQLEARYRLLFDSSPEAILVVDTATRRISDANPAARRLAGQNGTPIEGRNFADLVHPEDREAAIALLGAIAAASQHQPVRVRLGHGEPATMTATLFRQDRGTFLLLRLRPDAAPPPLDRSLAALLERIPDPFVMTDEGLRILACNSALLDLVQQPRREALIGTGLDAVLGRPGIDMPLMIAALRDHGSVANFASVIRGLHGTDSDVELSAVTVKEGADTRFALTIRPVRRAATETGVPGLTRSVEQLTDLVGRVPLKDIVRESTDLIERLCIEAALNYTSDNRASAAEILGLSRQSLYSKLHRHGLGNLGADTDGD